MIVSYQKYDRFIPNETKRNKNGKSQETREIARRKRRRKRKTSKSGKNRTPIIGHARIGHELVPPFAKLKLNAKFNLELSSWMNDRLPEMLWAALIVTLFDRDSALAYFRHLLNFICSHKRNEELHDVTLTGIAKLDENLRNELIGVMAEPGVISRTLTTMLMFDALPAREDWRKHLPLVKPDVDHLMASVGAVLWHQSQEATDCRWMRLMATMAAGKLNFTVDTEELLDDLLKYPNVTDRGKAYPGLRAAEGSLSALQREPCDLTWPRDFWHQSWVETPCILLKQEYGQPTFEKTVTRQVISDTRKRLEGHWLQTHSTTRIDPKHDAVFGMAFYCLRVLEEMLSIGIGTSVLGRLGLRTVGEVRINLSYLLVNDSPELWKKWREFGAGQAKLNALKFDDSIDPPKYIDMESIEQIASEDMWEEYLTVNLAGWSRLDLRRMSEKSGLKDTYDQHYSWTSGYSHGMWGAVRESCYQTCANPLHRLHRYPERLSLQDTVDDAAKLVDEVLRQLDQAYPTFEYRLFVE